MSCILAPSMPRRTNTASAASRMRVFVSVAVCPDGLTTWLAYTDRTAITSATFLGLRRISVCGCWASEDSPLLRPLDRSAFCRPIKPIECSLLRVEPDVRIVLEHPPRDVAGNRFDHVIRLAGLEKPSDNG